MVQDSILKVMKVSLDEFIPYLVKDYDVESLRAYYNFLGLYDRYSDVIVSRNGGTIFKDNKRTGSLRVESRVGQYNTERTLDEIEGFGSTLISNIPLNFSEVILTEEIRNLIWDTFIEALEDYWDNMKGDVSGDRDVLAPFVPRTPMVFEESGDIPSFDLQELEDKLNYLSSKFMQHPHIINGESLFNSKTEVRRFVNSEGTMILTRDSYFFLKISAQTVADDGMVLRNYKRYAVMDIKELPNFETLEKDLEQLVQELESLRKAPVEKGSTRPLLASPECSGVMFHEMLGHRFEAHRIQEDTDWDTFEESLGQKRIPDFITITDDPTLSHYNGQTLFGHYRADDEGVPPKRTILIENGEVKEYLMTRSPVETLFDSNGHARLDEDSSECDIPVARMGNLIIESTEEHSLEEMRGMLIEDCLKLGLKYGYLTLTTRGAYTYNEEEATWQESFILAYRLYAQEVKCKDCEKVHKPGDIELIRGIQLFNSPLVSLFNVRAMSKEKGLGPGYCGAESGCVPVSELAPWVYFNMLETQSIIDGNNQSDLKVPNPIPKKCQT